MVGWLTSPELKIPKIPIFNLQKLDWNWPPAQKTPRKWRDLGESFSQHILFFSDSNFKSKNFASQVSDKSEISLLGNRKINDFQEIVFMKIKVTFSPYGINFFVFEENHKKSHKVAPIARPSIFHSQVYTLATRYVAWCGATRATTDRDRRRSRKLP